MAYCGPTGYECSPSKFKFKFGREVYGIARRPRSGGLSPNTPCRRKGGARSMMSRRERRATGVKA